MSIVKSGGDATGPYFIPIMEILDAYLKPGIDEKLETLQIMVIRKWYLIIKKKIYISNIYFII